MIQIVTQVTRLQDRPKLFGAFGAVFGLSSVIGPLIGGALTDHVSLPISRFCCTPHLYIYDRLLGYVIPCCKNFHPLTSATNLALVLFYQPPHRWRLPLCRCSPTEVIPTPRIRSHEADAA